ncbi:MAG: hypothetical protein ACYSWQ_01495 [Planctomycetota bacterium]
MAVALVLSLRADLTSFALVVKTKAAKATAVPPAPAGEVFEMEEVPAFDTIAYRLRYGMPSRECGPEPSKKVKFYPEFNSDKPLYGKTTFDMSLVRYMSRDRSGIDYYFAVDESAGTGKGYDRLYFDANHDLDLTNDRVLLPMKDPPKQLIREDIWQKNTVAFEYLEFDLYRGPGKLSAQTKVIPLYRERSIFKTFEHDVSLFPPTVRKGKIKIGSEEFEAVLSQSLTITGTYASPIAYLDLGEEIHSRPLICGRHNDDGMFYTFSTTVSGDKLKVTPYTGAFGFLGIGTGGSNIREGKAERGILLSENLAFNVAKCPTVDGKLKVPVGDYAPIALTLHLGDISVEHGWLSSHPGDTHNKPPKFDIRIRKNQLCVLNFGGKPDIIFRTPATNSRFKVGSEIKIETLVHDTLIGVSIAELEDTEQKADIRAKGRIPTEYQPARPREYQAIPSIDPIVTITNSLGELVARGNMPFSPDDPQTYSWRVPENLQLDGNEEIFTIRVEYDTKELYGKVSATRKMTICRD